MDNTTIISWNITTSAGNFSDSVKASELGLNGDTSVTEVPLDTARIARIMADSSLNDDERSAAIHAIVTERNDQVLNKAEQVGDITVRVRQAVLDRIRSANGSVVLGIEDLQTSRFAAEDNKPEIWHIALTSSYGN